MDSVKATETPPLYHITALPYPGRGHINPMINFCKLLASKSTTKILITFIVTEEWLTLISTSQKRAMMKSTTKILITFIVTNILFRTIPNVIPSEFIREADIIGFVEAVQTKMESPIEKVLEQLEPPVSAILGDSSLGYAVAIGNRRNIPVASLWPMSPAIFSLLHHFDVLVQNHDFPVHDLKERGSESVSNFPGISSMNLGDSPGIFSGLGQQILDRILETFSWVLKAQCLLFTSFYELQTQVIDNLREILPFQVYTIGPSIPISTLIDIPTIADTSCDDMNYFKWLDSQPISSVLYVSMGSFLSVSTEQMDEIAAGLHCSGVRYLWVGRGDLSRLQEACGDMGLVVSWCDQLRVLCHPSVGGFWTHCGWNSTLEALYSGVPMLTFPISFDQTPNSDFIVDDLKVGLRVKDEEAKKIVVRREAIASTVQRFLELDGDESKEIRGRARELQETCRQALEKGGSSQRNLDDFVRNILQCQI